MLDVLLNLNFQELFNTLMLALGAFVALLGALYSLFLLVPGDEPDNTIKKIYDFTVKFSRKKE